MEIEQPEEKPDFPIVERLSLTGAAPEQAMTIGQFYEALDAFLATLDPSDWQSGNNQIDDDQFFPGQLFAVNAYPDAHRAISIIVSEGEGAKDYPLDFSEELAHYYRFGEVFYDKVLTKASGDPGYQWGPEPLGVVWTDVYPCIADPGAHDFSKEPAAAQAAQAALQRRLQPDGRRVAARRHRPAGAARHRRPRDVRPAARDPGRAAHPAQRPRDGRRARLPLSADQPGSFVMSVLETPRILFRGQISWDPITTNNYQSLYDENDCEPLPAHGPVAAFRQTAIASVGSRGNWNPHGTHRSSFFATEISGADLGDGITTDDPFVGSPASFTGMLVDAEPYGGVTSQLFFDTMNFGIPGGCRIACPRRSRFIARSINFTRNSANTMIAGVGSVVWQTSFAKSDGLVVDAQDSPALQALADALAGEDVLGLTVRWNAYRTIYYDDPSLTNGAPASQAAAQALIAKLKAGGFQPNPARSLVVGVIGLWRESEPASEPGDRALLSVPPGEILASAHARLCGDRLAIDLSNSISEVDELLSKQDLGRLSVVAVGPDGKSVVATLGRLSYPQYDRTAYERGSGIVTLKLSPEAASAAANADLQIRDGEGNIYLAEAALRALPDEHNRYVDEDDPAAPLGVQVYDRGAPAGAGIEVTMYDGNSMDVLGTATTDGSGAVSFSIAPIAGGAVQPYVFAAGAGDPPAQLDPQLTPYAYVRTLPADAKIAALPPTWANVYNLVLANWNAMAPCMDNWLRLDDEDQVRAYAPMLKRLTDPGYFEAFRYMPVTRDMTKGERSLLYAFLDGPPAAHRMTMTEEVEAEPAAKPRRDVAALSRSMRNN